MNLNPTIWSSKHVIISVLLSIKCGYFCHILLLFESERVVVMKSQKNHCYVSTDVTSYVTFVFLSLVRRMETFH